MTVRGHLFFILLFAMTIIPNIQAQKPISDDIDLSKLIELTSADVDSYWEMIFLSLRRNYNSPHVQLFREQNVRTACGRNSWVVGAFYCPLDNSIYLPYRFMEFQRDKIGNAAVITIIAHEWGHAVQAQLNTLRNRSIVISELQADCFAGAYALHYMSSPNVVIVEKARFERDASILFSAGDRDIFWFDPQTHGMSKQRITSFDRGITLGYMACLPD